jgi:hypothetical protein
MRPLLWRLALLGLLALGTMGGGVAVASAQSCAPGSTDCAMRTQDQRWGQRGRSGHRTDWRDDRRDRRWDRHDRRVERRWDRHDRRWDRRDRRWDRHHHRPRVRSGIYLHFGGGPYYDPPTYRYVDPAPRYRVTRLSQAHIDWCYSRYKTYRLSDNTYKPTVHTRRQCVSPYL